MKEAKDKYGCKLYAYTLMSNHYHLLLKVEDPNLSTIMQYLNTKYGMYFNLKYKRNGHLFQSRFKSVIVEHGQNLLEVMRYIHLNPLRARMVEKLDDYAWTSHRQYRGQYDKGPAETWHLLKLFSAEKTEAIRKYETYMGEGAIKDKDGDTMGYFGKHAIGSDDFVRDIKLMFKEKDLSKEINDRGQLKKVFAPDQVLQALCSHYEIGIEDLKQKGKWGSNKPLAYYLLSYDCGLTNNAIAGYFGGLHPCIISRQIKKVLAVKDKNIKLKKDIESVRRKYMKEDEKAISKV